MDGWRARDGWRLAPALAFLTVLVFASAFSHINIGIRHVLVLYPFMALGGAHAVVLAWRFLPLSWLDWCDPRQGGNDRTSAIACSAQHQRRARHAAAVRGG